MTGKADLQAIIDRQNRENANENARLARAQKVALQAATELAARMGSEDPTLRRVILFGSTLPGRRYRAGSDIDLAVDGGDSPLRSEVAPIFTDSLRS
jgi:predicted nucleotidyltransferase